MGASGSKHAAGAGGADMTITTEEAEECARGQDSIKDSSQFPGYRSIAERAADTIRSLAAERDALQAENARLQGARRLRAGRTTRKCVNAHDRCYGGDGGPCDYCEIVEKTQ